MNREKRCSNPDGPVLSGPRSFLFSDQNVPPGLLESQWFMRVVDAHVRQDSQHLVALLLSTSQSGLCLLDSRLPNPPASVFTQHSNLIWKGICPPQVSTIPYQSASISASHALSITMTTTPPTNPPSTALSLPCSLALSSQLRHRLQSPLGGIDGGRPSHPTSHPTSRNSSTSSSSESSHPGPAVSRLRPSARILSGRTSASATAPLRKPFLCAQPSHWAPSASASSGVFTTS